MTDDVHQTLLKSMLFRGVSTSLVSAVAARCEALVLASREKLLSAGARNDRLYVVLSGSIGLHVAGKDSAYVRLGPGDCVGEISLLNGGPTSVDVVAEESSVLIWLDREQLWALVDASPDLARNLLRVMAGRVRHHEKDAATRSQRFLEQSGTTDVLTGLRNRRWLDDAFARTIERTARTAQPTSVLIVDLDHFGELIIAHGPIVADALLCRAAELLAAALRPQDLLARYGGEEFAVLLPGLDATASIAVAERLRLAVEATPTDPGGGALPSMTISIGGTTRRPFESLRDLLKRAEAALGRARDAGNNRSSE